MADPGQNRSAAGEVLRIENLQAWYGESHVLHGVDLVVHKGEVVTLLGRNGAGRTSTLKSILGLVGRRSGSIKVNGVDTGKVTPAAISLDPAGARAVELSLNGYEPARIFAVVIA